MGSSFSNLINIKKKEIKTQVVINILEDFPTIVIGETRYIQHKKGIEYIMTTSIESPYTTFASEDYGASTLTSVGSVLHEYKYTGTGVAFTDRDAKFGLLNLEGVSLSAPNGTLFDIETDDTEDGGYFGIVNSFVSDVDTLGYIGANVAVDYFFTAFYDCGDGMVIGSGAREVSIGSNTWFKYWKNRENSVMITIQGDNSQLQMSGFIVVSNSNETVFDIKSDSTIQEGIVNGGVVSGEGQVFASGSKDQSDVNWKYVGVGGIPDSTTTAEHYLPTNSSVTEIHAQNTFHFINATGFTTKNLERMEAESDGGMKYIGLDDVKLAGDGNLRLKPTVASYDLTASFCAYSDEKRVVTFTNATNIINETTTPRENGDIINFRNTEGVLPTGVYDNVVYYIINKTTNSFQISYTLGGSAVTFTTDGTGTNIYQLTSLYGSTPTVEIASNAPKELIPQALVDLETNDEIYLLVGNSGGVVNIIVEKEYYRIKK